MHIGMSRERKMEKERGGGERERRGQLDLDHLYIDDGSRTFSIRKKRVPQVLSICNVDI